MKLNNDKFYVVYSPTDISEKVDIFTGRSNDLKGLYLQIKGGLRKDQIYGFYNYKSAAQRDADMLWRKHKNLDTGATYGIYNSDGTFKFKKTFTSQVELQNYLDQMYASGKHYAAYKLTESPKRISKAQLKRFEEKIDNDNDISVIDKLALEKLFYSLANKPASEGMIIANSFDTFLREFIPNDIWVAMGGTLNNS